jgi:hypothetical protein
LCKLGTDVLEPASPGGDLVSFDRRTEDPAANSGHDADDGDQRASDLAI